MVRTSFIWMAAVMFISQVASEIPTMTDKPTMQWTLEANSIECYLMECKIVFHLPLRVPDAIFKGLDDDVDDDVPVDVGTAATAADPATAPKLPEWITNNLNNDGVVEDLGITNTSGK